MRKELLPSFFPSFPPSPRDAGCMMGAIHTYTRLGGRRGRYFRQEGEQPTPVPHPKPSQKKERKASATILSAQHTLPPRSDSSLTHIWERNLFPALGSTEGEGAQGKTPTHPIQTPSAKIPWLYPALLQCSWYSSILSLGINLKPCRSRIWSEEREPLHSAFFPLCTACFESYMLFLWTPKEDFVSRRIQLQCLSSKARARTQGYTYQRNTRSVLPTSQIKAATALLKSQPLSWNKSPMWNKFSNFLSNQKKPFKSRRSKSSV